MQFATYQQYQFLNAQALNLAWTRESSNWTNNGAYFHTSGVANGSDIIFGTSSLTVNITAAPPVAVQFSSGVFAQGFGNSNGVSSSVYSLNVSSFVPGSGSQTVYIVAQVASILENQQLIVGPPAGHPDYDPTYNPTLQYLETWDSFNLVATLTTPNNTTNVEICRFVLSSGQSSIPASSIVTSNQVKAGNLLIGNFVNSFNGRNGTVVPLVGDYSTWYGQLAASNNWVSGTTNTWNGSSVFNGLSDFYANVLISAVQSGGANSSPTLTLQGWTGSAGIYSQLNADSSGNLLLNFSGSNGAFAEFLNASASFELNAQQSGGAAVSPSLYLRAWSGSTAIGQYLYAGTAGTLYSKNLGNTQLFALDQLGNETIPGTMTASAFINTANSSANSWDGNGNLTISSLQSGSAANSPYLNLRSWNGSGSYTTSLQNTSAGSLIVSTSLTTNYAYFDSSWNFNLTVPQSGGGALGSPSIIFNGWSGSANLSAYTNVSSAGVMNLSAGGYINLQVYPGSTGYANLLYGGSQKGYTVTGGFTVVGTCTATTFNSTSSERYKEAISAYTDSLSNFMKLRPIQFNWKDKYLFDNSNPDKIIDRRHLPKHSFGFLAEEMDEIYPEVVGHENRQAVGIDYSKLVVPTIFMVQGHELELQALKNRISLLEKRLGI